jgi:protein involved in polysaccharide export with SLBB domain
VQAEGLTEAQLEQAISAAYRDQQIIQQAQVSVQIQIAQSRTFSILGSVQQPGQYAIPRNDFRLLDALVSARDLTVDTDIRGTRGIENIYVLRRERSDYGARQPGGAAPHRPNTQSSPADILVPGNRPTTQPSGEKQMMLLQVSAQGNEPTTAPAVPSTGPSTPAEGRYIIGPDGKPQLVGGPTEAAPPAPAPVPNAPLAPNPQVDGTSPGESLPPGATTNFVFNDLKTPIDTRIIRVPVGALRQGDLRYNIIIRPDDMIVVRPPVIGEYYMGGHVARVGVYSLTARKISLTQAVISAGMLDQLAVPGRCQIIRRIGSDHQCFARVDLEKIFSGEQPDIYLKPDDQVLVGTNAAAPFLAAIRGGFRMTYGFGFLYDRNYAYDNNGQAR